MNVFVAINMAAKSMIAIGKLDKFIITFCVYSHSKR